MRARWLFGIVVAAGCSTFGPEVPLDPDVSTHVEYKDIPVSTERRLDVLFVVDDSPQMAAFGAELSANWPQFINVLDTVEGGLPPVHIGVVTGDPADGGDMHRAARVHGRFLVDQIAPDGSHVRNYSGSLADAFTELASVGARGAAEQEPLAMAVRALHDPHNAGFLRADAYLAVIIVSAQDDHSPQQTSALATELLALKDDRQKILVAAISGPRDSSCTFAGATALATPRLGAFTYAFPNRSTFTTICDNDLTDGLVLVALVDDDFVPISSPCLDRTPLELPDGQADCSVSDVQNVGTARQAEQILPACAPGGALPCWRIAIDPEDCPFGDEVALAVDRAGYAPDNDHVIANCVVE